MKVLILGAGKMGSFFTDLLSFDHEVGVYEKDPKRLRFTYNCQRFTDLEEIRAFEPELCINAVTVKYTISAFNEVIPYLPQNCILSDIASVKTGLLDFYKSTGRRFVSTHPMFGPTFANLNQLSEENAIVINEGDYMGRCFFKDLYSRLDLNIYEYSFEEHDRAPPSSAICALPRACSTRTTTFCRKCCSTPTPTTRSIRYARSSKTSSPSSTTKTLQA